MVFLDRRVAFDHLAGRLAQVEAHPPLVLSRLRPNRCLAGSFLPPLRVQDLSELPNEIKPELSGCARSAKKTKNSSSSALLSIDRPGLDKG